MLRNMSLRLLLASDYKKHRCAWETLKTVTEEKLIQWYEISLVKYGEMTSEYYCLSEEERKLIESMMDLFL
jgi:hypothetical protein